MKIFVISLLANNAKRRQHIEKEFSEKNVKFEFFDAITPDMNKTLMSKYHLENIPTNLTEKEISCFLSHYVLWNYVVENDLNHIAIFEDDIYLGNNVQNFLTDSNWIDPNIDIIKLEKGVQTTVKCSFKHTEIFGRSIYRLKSTHYGTAGYIISNKGAKYLIEQYSNATELFAVDVHIFENYLKNKSYIVMQLLPALCIQDFVAHHLNLNNEITLESSLQVGRINNQSSQIKTRKNKTILYKIIREIIRPLFQIYNFFYKRLYTKNVTYK